MLNTHGMPGFNDKEMLYFYSLLKMIGHEYMIQSHTYNNKSY